MTVGIYFNIQHLRIILKGFEFETFPLIFKEQANCGGTSIDQRRKTNILKQIITDSGLSIQNVNVEESLGKMFDWIKV